MAISGQLKRIAYPFIVQILLLQAIVIRSGRCCLRSARVFRHIIDQLDPSIFVLLTHQMTLTRLKCEFRTNAKRRHTISDPETRFLGTRSPILTFFFIPSNVWMQAVATICNPGSSSLTLLQTYSNLSFSCKYKWIFYYETFHDKT